jgi:CDGSH-type Zn-finger protein
MADPLHGKAPIVIDETAGRKAYCTCGHSQNLPHCDGSHGRQQTGLTPAIVEITEDKKVAVCQCHQSKNMPFCDGTHGTL